MQTEYYKIGITKIRLIAPDLDGDGITGGKENVNIKSSVSEIIPATQKSQTAEAVENLNKDVVDASRLSTIDFLSRIDKAEYDAMVKLDALISLKALPNSASWINRSKMRKSVSIDGKGRGEYVQLVTGQEDKLAKASGMNKFLGIEK